MDEIMIFSRGYYINNGEVIVDDFSDYGINIKQFLTAEKQEMNIRLELKTKNSSTQVEVNLEDILIIRDVFNNFIKEYNELNPKPEPEMYVPRCKKCGRIPKTYEMFVNDKCHECLILGNDTHVYKVENHNG